METYIGPYKLVRFFASGRKKVVKRNLTLEEARSQTQQYKSTRSSFVGFAKQFSAEKYFIKS